MRTLSLARHGEHIHPAYRPTPGGKPGPAGRSTEAERPGGQVSGVVERFDKKRAAAKSALTLGLLKSSREAAIEYTGRVEGLRGMIMVFGLFGGAIGLGVGLTEMRDAYGDSLFNLITGGILFGPAFVVAGLYALLKASRLELFCPEDEPLIFDRAHRKVYRLFRETHPGIQGVFKPWPLRACEYEWDLIDVEHNAQLITNGSTVTRRHALVFIVRRSANDPTIIDSFQIGNAMLLGEPTVAPVWEHIRRFMEDGGPQLPPGETLAPTVRPKTWWQSMGAVGPIGPHYRQWWRDSPGIMVIMHVLSPLFVPLMLGVGFFNWLSHKTLTTVDWPDEVKQRLQSVQPDDDTIAANGVAVAQD